MVNLGHFTQIYKKMVSLRKALLIKDNFGQFSKLRDGMLIQRACQPHSMNALFVTDSTSRPLAV